MGNKYFVDESPKVRLPEEYALYALQLLEQKLESDISISVSSFAQDFCQPMSTVHSWKKQMLQRFGTAIGNAPAFQRVMRMLTSEGGRLGRQKVVQWFGRKYLSYIVLSMCIGFKGQSMPSFNHASTFLASMWPCGLHFAFRFQLSCSSR